jgi:adenylylsulfate kinase-like enzyme
MIRHAFPASSFCAIASDVSKTIGGRFMRKKNVEVYELALKMAGSGKFKSWKGIRDDLVEKGYRRAPDLLDGDKIRMILDLHCADSQKAETNSK